ncbi:hypothetical protein DOY81_000200, partial [Sarcophaga bullata]
LYVYFDKINTNIFTNVYIIVAILKPLEDEPNDMPVFLEEQHSIAKSINFG